MDSIAQRFGSRVGNNNITNNTNSSEAKKEQEAAASFLESQAVTDSAGAANIFLVQPSQKEIALKKMVVSEFEIAKRNMEVREIKRVANSAAYAKNLAYAELICKTVRGFVPLGTNTADDARKSSISFEQKVELIQKQRYECAMRMGPYQSLSAFTAPEKDQIFKDWIEILRKYKYGHCAELATAAFVEAQKNPDISDISYCGTSEGKHRFIVIGKRNDVNWDEDAVICDAWAKKCYAVAEFDEMQKPENDVKYAEEFYRPENFRFFSDKRAPRPYLAGEINVDHSWRRPE